MITTKNRVYPQSAPAPPTGEDETFGEKLQSFALRAKDAAGANIARHPVIVVGGALTIGVLLGWLIKRR